MEPSILWDINITPFIKEKTMYNKNLKATSKIGPYIKFGEEMSKLFRQIMLVNFKQNFLECVWDLNSENWNWN